ncbi:MAG: M1 family metallopeptidase [Bacteroidales bacterium]|nr:M1 family metallopeptidase [Bacteroidales bacterium]
MKIIKSIVFTTIFLIVYTNCFSQLKGFFVPINIQKAYSKKTRSFDGKPGIVYWQNRSDYKIKVALNPKSLLVEGEETITYLNNSPDTLRRIIFHLFPNMYKKGNMRDTDIDPADESDGLVIDKMAVNGKEVPISLSSDFIYIEHTLLRLNLETPLKPQKQTSIDISWHYTLNKGSQIRTGEVDSTSFFIAYFFPRIAVYDDIDGWNYYKYTSDSEFYNEFGNFDVSISMPKNYLVWATGVLKNPEEVLNDKYLNRYKAANQSNVIMHIVDTADLKLRDFTKSDTNTWKFKAENVTDFVFGTSNHYLWDATSIIVDSKTGRKLFLDAAYNKDSKDFYNVISIARQSVELMCNSFPGYPFPFPKETVFNGLSEMEYPMMANDRSSDDIHYTTDLTAHEIFHSYFPFYCGFNEVNYAWMDEGITSFATYQMVSTMDSGYEKVCYIDEYRPYMGTYLDLPVFTLSNSIRRPAYDFMSYPKPALFFIFLKDVIGTDLFNKSFQEFIVRWNGKHPTPYDLFNTISTISGQNISWLIKPWIFEYGYVDLGVKDISESTGKYLITIERKGNYPAPINLKITYDDDFVDKTHHSAAVWKNGEETYSIEKLTYKKIKKVELIDDYGIDINPMNNSYTLNGWKMNCK